MEELKKTDNFRLVASQLKMSSSNSAAAVHMVTGEEVMRRMEAPENMPVLGLSTLLGLGKGSSSQSGHT